MSTTKQPPPKKFDRNSEIRIRGVKPQVQKELDEIRKVLGKPFDSEAITYLIENYRDDKNLYRQLQARNNELHKRIARYVEAEADMKKLMKEFIAATVQFNRMTVTGATKILKKFGGTVGARSLATGGNPGKASVPRKKKGGGK